MGELLDFPTNIVNGTTPDASEVMGNFEYLRTYLNGPHISTENIAPGGIEQASLATDSVGTDQLQDGSVTDDKLANPSSGGLPSSTGTFVAYSSLVQAIPWATYTPLELERTLYNEGDWYDTTAMRYRTLEPCFVLLGAKAVCGESISEGQKWNIQMIHAPGGSLDTNVSSAQQLGGQGSQLDATAQCTIIRKAEAGDEFYVKVRHTDVNKQDRDVKNGSAYTAFWGHPISTY